MKPLDLSLLADENIYPDSSVHQDDTIQAWRKQIVRLDPRQIAVWRAMTPAQRLDLACQAYQFALDAVRLTERRKHPDLAPGALAWRVTRRMQGDRSLGREYEVAQGMEAD